MNRVTPVSSSTAPVSVPASGKNVPHSTAASTGPSMKHSSSAACSKEFAVCSASGLPFSRCAQRARDIPPVFGVVAVAAYEANSVQPGASYRTQATSASEPSTAISVAGSAMRACP